jgi:hypothetical protein
VRRTHDRLRDGKAGRQDWVPGSNCEQTDTSIMSIAQATQTVTPYIDFWNAVLVPKFNAWRHILAGGLHLHSAIRRQRPGCRMRLGRHRD